MKSLKISGRISVSFYMVNTIYLLAIVALLLSYKMSNDRLNNMNSNAVNPLISIGEIKSALADERDAARQLVLLTPGTPEYMAAEDALASGRERVTTAIGKYTGGQAANMKSYYENIYSPYISQLAALAAQDDDAAAIELMLAQQATEEGMDGQLTAASGLVDDTIAYYIRDAWIGYIRLLIIAAVVLTLVLILIGYILRFMKRMISKRIEVLNAAAQRLAVGDLDIELTAGGSDEISDLTESFLSMTESIRTQARTLTSVAEGDLTVDIDPRCEHDIMNISIKKMIEGLNQMFAQISNSAEQVSYGARQISGGAQVLAQGTTEQASAVEQLSGSISGVAQTTHDNSNMAKKAAELMDSVNESAVKGSGQMGKMAQAVEEISAASQSISKVIKVIDDIAFQTNILSLNAAVEAARAGQHGKGFAVVAEEVRNLASKSAEAARDTGSLIENSMEKARLGARIAGETVESFQQIASGIGESTGLINDIAARSQEQSAAITQINQGISQVAQVVQQNSATAEESAAASEELSGQSELLKGFTAQVKVRQLSQAQMEEYSTLMLP